MRRERFQDFSLPEPAARPVAAAARDPGGGGDRPPARGSACWAGSRTRTGRGSRSRRSSWTSCGRSSGGDGLGRERQRAPDRPGRRPAGDQRRRPARRVRARVVPDVRRHPPRCSPACEPGMTEAEAVRLLRWNGMPLSCHLMLTAGPRAALGLLSPADRPIGRGEPFTTAFGIWGALTCRAGWVAEDADELPDGVARLRRPARRAVLRGGRRVVRRPPRRAGRRRPAGDHRPAAGRPVLRHRPQPGPPAAPRRVGQLARLARLDRRAPIGDGDAGRHHPGHRHAVLHDQHRGRDRARRRRAAGAFAAAYPEAWARIQARRAFMGDVLGIDLHPDVLPLSNLAGGAAAVPAAPGPGARRWPADGTAARRGPAPARLPESSAACYSPPVEEQGIQSRHRSCRRIECRSRGRRSKR